MSTSQTDVNLWLESVVTRPELHIENIMLGAMLMGTNVTTGVPNIKQEYGINLLSSTLVAAINYLPNLVSSRGISAEVFKTANSLLDELKDPNIEGIPIHATQEMQVADNEVSKLVVIDEVAANKKQVVDNAVPQLKQWTIRGHLVATGNNTPLDAALIIKPTLIAQRELLQWYMDSRRPVWYKTHDNKFYKVLISHFQSGYNTNYLNGLDVELQLTEFSVLSVTSETTDVTIMTEVVG